MNSTGSADMDIGTIETEIDEDEGEECDGQDSAGYLRGIPMCKWRQEEKGLQGKVENKGESKGLGKGKTGKGWWNHLIKGKTNIRNVCECEEESCKEEIVQHANPDIRQGRPSPQWVRHSRAIGFH